MFGPDVSSSLTIKELSQLIEGIRFIDCMRSNPVNKDQISNAKNNLVNLFSKSPIANRDLGKGDYVKENDLIWRKPCNGLNEQIFDSLKNKCLNKNILRGTFLSLEDFSEK
jgi:N-acetylneuraminate synthase